MIAVLVLTVGLAMQFFALSYDAKLRLELTLDAQHAWWGRIIVSGRRRGIRQIESAPSQRSLEVVQ